MIIGPNFVWLHFPKTGGTETERLLRQFWSDRADVKFDLTGVRPVTWHQNLTQRLESDPNFSLVGRQVFSGFRRLPAWILSRAVYEASRSPHHTATREMIEEGRFFENDGKINQADMYLNFYQYKKVDRWIRTEYLAIDLASVFNLAENDVDLKLKTTNVTNKINAIEFWFTPQQLDKLYSKNPIWAELENKLYGNLWSAGSA